MNLFVRHFSTRCYDVGIAEQHAVTFAAGLTCESLKSLCARYLSFLQRAYDQKLPVRFELDRCVEYWCNYISRQACSQLIQCIIYAHVPVCSFLWPHITTNKKTWTNRLLSTGFVLMSPASWTLHCRLLP